MNNRCLESDTDCPPKACLVDRLNINFMKLFNLSTKDLTEKQKRIKFTLVALVDKLENVSVYKLGEVMDNCGDEENKLALDDDGQYMFACTVREDENRYDANMPVFIGKSNSFIKRIGKTTLRSEQALLLAIHKVKERKRESIAGTKLELYYDELKKKSGTDFSEGLIATFTSSELKSLMNIKTSRYAAAMDDLMNMNIFTNSWHILYNDNGVMTDTACITASLYDKKTGRVSIKFNADIGDKIINLKKSGGYTLLNSMIMRKVSKDLTTWSIYQLLREEIAYKESLNRKKGLPDRKEYVTEFGLAEFKFLTTVNQVDLSSAEPDQLACARLIKERNYDEAEQVLKSRQYDEWKDLRRRVLTKANKIINGWEGNGCYGPKEEEIEEYEEKCGQFHETDIHFRCEPVKQGAGAKVSAIRFYLRWDREMSENESDEKTGEIIDDAKKSAADVNQEECEKKPVDENAFADSVSELIEEKMRVGELKSIAEVSNYDLEKVRVTYMKLKKDGGMVTAGMMLAALNGEKTVTAEDGTKNAFYRKKFPGFTMEEIDLMVDEATKHRPYGYPDTAMTWVEKYIGYYRDKVLATPDDTKTTLFKRLMDMLRHDYDRFSEGKAPQDKGKPHFDYKQREYSDEELKEQSRKLLRRSLILKNDEEKDK